MCLSFTLFELQIWQAGLNHKKLMYWDNAYIRLGTPYQCRHLANQYEWMSVNQLSVSPNSIEYGKQFLYPDGDPDRHQNLIICSLAHCQPSMKISWKSDRKFLRKVANRQTDKQTTTITYPPWRRYVITRRPASADRTARRQFHATGQPVSRTQVSDAMTSRLPRYEAKCVQRRCFQSVCARISRERSYALPIYWYHSKGNWLRYNFAADSFYTQWTIKNVTFYFWR